MLRISCCVCGSMFLVAELPEDRPLCPACHTVDAANRKGARPKRKAPKSPATADVVAAEKGTL